MLRYYAGLPDTQIAAALGTSARAVTCHIGCGLSSLQASQEEQEQAIALCRGHARRHRKDARDEHGQEARPVVGRGQALDRECVREDAH